MKDTNNITIVGRLTRDPETKTIPNGKIVTTFSIANNGFGDDVSYFNVQTWSNTAEFCSQYLHKGSQIIVDGRIKQDRWEKDGQKKSRVIIVANGIQALSSKNKIDNITGATDPTFADDNIPF